MSKETENTETVEQTHEELQSEKSDETLESTDHSEAVEIEEEPVPNNDKHEEEIEALKKKLEETEDSYLRLQAELQNIQRRHKKERQDDRKFRAQSLAGDLIPVIDNLQRALSIEVTDEQGKNLKKGIEMVMESFRAALVKEGVEMIDPLNEPFDPQYHEAYTTVPAEEGQESGVVAEVYEKGYVLNGRILRAAKVSVTE